MKARQEIERDEAPLAPGAEAIAAVLTEGEKEVAAGRSVPMVRVMQRFDDALELIRERQHSSGT